uniref:Uncharacterized protein n=1 Tax=Picea glauca TaxID=3330 RepID=A0A101LZ61_PICGL|nr:hypothetical protein ABT39_MTgene5055 [Picea glauca]
MSRSPIYLMNQGTYLMNQGVKRGLPLLNQGFIPHTYLIHQGVILILAFCEIHWDSNPPEPTMVVPPCRSSLSIGNWEILALDSLTLYSYSITGGLVSLLAWTGKGRSDSNSH